jgi:hypothetical protein
MHRSDKTGPPSSKRELLVGTVRLPLFDALLQYADDQEKGHLLGIAQEKPSRYDTRQHPRPSLMDQMLEGIELTMAQEDDEETRTHLQSIADGYRTQIARRGAVEDESDPYVQYSRAVLAIDTILQRMVNDPTLSFSGVLFGEDLPVRSLILPELLRGASVHWSSNDNACLMCSGACYEYYFQHVSVQVPAPKRDGRKMPREILDPRMDWMKKLVLQGVQRQPAAHQAVHEIQYRDQSAESAVKCLMREWDRRGWRKLEPPDQTRRRQPGSLAHVRSQESNS